VSDTPSGGARDAATEHVKELVVQQPVIGAPTSGWAFLLRGPRLALAPSRLMLGFLAAAIVMGAGTLFDLARGPIPEPGPGRGLFETLAAGVLLGAGETASGVMTLDPGRALRGVVAGFWGAPSALAEVAPWSSAVLALLLLPILVFFGGAIARSAVVEAARDRSISGAQALAYALTKRGALVGAFVAPLVAAGVLAGLLWLFGLALLSLPGLDVAGGLLYGVAAVLGLLLAVIVFALALGFPLLVPAVAADASDSVDAVQRAYAYLLDKPARLLLWAAALIAQGAAGLFVVTFLLVTALNWAAELTLIGEPAIAGELRLFRPIPERPEVEGSLAVAAAMIGVWERLTLLVAGAFGVSFFFCASSLVYLRIRRDCDGQAIDDIWPRETVLEKARRGEIERLPDVSPEEGQRDG